MSTVNDTTEADKTAKLVERGILSQAEANINLAVEAALSEDVAEDITAPEVAEGSPEAAPDNVLSAATDAEQKKLIAYKAAQTEVVELAIATLDPKDMLRKYVRLGQAGLKLATTRKNSLKAGSWNGKIDLAGVCTDLEILVKMRVAIRDVRMLVYIKVCLWVAAVKPLAPEVERLSYHQVVNKFLPTLEFDMEALTGEIKAGWLGWVTSTVAQQLGDEPLSMSGLDTAIREHQTELTRLKNLKKDPEKALAQEQKAADAKIRADRKASQSEISEALDQALVKDHVDANDVLDIVGKVLKDHKIEMPANGFDASKATINDVKMLARQLMAAGKYVEMVALRGDLDTMIKMIDTARAASQQKVA